MTVKKTFNHTKHYSFREKRFNYVLGVKARKLAYDEQTCTLGKHLLQDNKKWGAELIICRKPHACKVMVLEPDTQVSMHFHEDKSESFVLIEGELIVESIILETGHKDTIYLKNRFDSITIPPRVPHTFYCPIGQEEPTIFIEASTEDSPYDNYRLFPSEGKDLDSGGSNS